MKKKGFSVLLLLLLCLTIISAQVPKFTDLYVNDFAKVLGKEDSTTLSTLFRLVYENTTAQIVFVSIEHIDDDISTYATQIGQEWGVGDKEKDNGVVILYVKDINKLWVATGYGVEGVMPDSKIGRFLDETYVPLRDKGDISQGIRAFSEVLTKELMDNNEELLASRKSDTSSTLTTILILLAVWIIILVIMKSLNKGRVGFMPIFLPGRIGGFSGGMSGGSFGGGGFGGGGAGR